MKVILEKRVEKLGLPGEIVNVSDGFARNFLMPKKIASKATKENIERIGKMVKKLELVYIKEIDEAKKAAAEIDQIAVALFMQAGENEKLFGSVTSQQIADALAEKGVTVDKKKIMVSSTIKQLGEYQVEIKVHPEVSANLKVTVEKKEE